MKTLKKYLGSFLVPPDVEAEFRERANKLTVTAEQPKLEVLVWEATRRCDLQCLHCGTPYDKELVADELTTVQVREIFRKVDAAFGINNLIAVSITGGEPTARTDLIELVSFIRLLGAPFITMHSNGHRISRNANLLPRLAAAGLSGIGLNLDGKEATHNWLRQDGDAFRHSIRALEIAQRLNLQTMISTVVTRRSLKDLVSLHDLMVNLSPQRWRLISIEPIGRARKEDLLTSEMTAELLGFILDTLENFPHLAIELGCGQWYGRKLEGLVRPYIWHCIAGLNLMSILYDGSIGGCNNIDTAFCQGNALKDDVLTVWLNQFQAFRDRERYCLGECRDCSDWEQCRGGEMHLRDSNGERLTSCFFCWMQKNNLLA